MVVEVVLEVALGALFPVFDLFAEWLPVRPDQGLALSPFFFVVGLEVAVVVVLTAAGPGSVLQDLTPTIFCCSSVRLLVSNLISAREERMMADRFL